jgi:hypothetical protein
LDANLGRAQDAPVDFPHSMSANCHLAPNNTSSHS